MAGLALPRYLGNKYTTTASPGDRFTLFFPVVLVDGRAKAAPVTAIELHDDDKERLAAIVERQTALLPSDDFVVDAVSAAPFMTGMGIEHPSENGFAFLNPYGLPYLPGSSVKGVLRKAAQELLPDGDFGGTSGWTSNIIDALFGLESGDHDTIHQRGTLSFWDVIPQLKSDTLIAEIMTPHQSHYLQGPESPHDSGKPNPITFLAVPAGSSFRFHISCDRRRLRRLMPELVAEKPQNDPWRDLITAAFEHAFEWLGFGAKTAVGYGAMRRDPKAAAERIADVKRREKQEQAREEREARRLAREKLPPLERKIQDAIDSKQQGQSDSSALFNAIEGGAFETAEIAAAAARLKTIMGEEKSWKESTAKKKPEKDRDYQRTLQVMKWLKG